MALIRDEEQSAAVKALLNVCKKEGLLKQKKVFRKQAIDYYDAKYKRVPGDSPWNSRRVWCHATGQFYDDCAISAVYTVPRCMESATIAGSVFGDTDISIDTTRNSFLVHDTIRYWLNHYMLVIIPVSSEEIPTRRWKMQLCTVDIMANRAWEEHCTTSISELEVIGGLRKMNDLENKELQFRNENRPSPRFLYFRYLMTLLRIKYLERKGWQSIWAEFYVQRPFPTPNHYLRGAILSILATYGGLTNPTLVEGFMLSNGVSVEHPPRLSREDMMVAQIIHNEIEKEEEAEDAWFVEESSEESSDDDFGFEED